MSGADDAPNEIRKLEMTGDVNAGGKMRLRIDATVPLSVALRVLLLLEADKREPPPPVPSS